VGRRGTRFRLRGMGIRRWRSSGASRAAQVRARTLTGIRGRRGNLEPRWGMDVQGAPWKMTPKVYKTARKSSEVMKSLCDK
jgi:hypothetical protein